MLVVGKIHAADPPRPNILFIFSDDLTCQSISCYGEKRHLLDTPNLDRIAGEGMRFDRCLVTNSICGPSRASILTGKYSHRNGFYNNTNSRFDSSQQTFPKMMKVAGYSTAVIGKWHLVSDPTGFDYWHILPGQGIYYNPPMIRNGEAVKHSGYTTDVITDLSIEWLKNRDRSKPFLLMCQHKAPHREWAPAIRHLGWDKDRQYPEPETLFDDYAGRSKAVSDHDMGIDRTFTDADAKFVAPPNMTEEQLKEWNAYYGPRNESFRKAALSGRDLVRWRYNRYMHDYLACVKAVDENVGRMLQFLEQEGLAENTIVVFSSDQGFFLGEHGWFDKRWIFEESLRTPLMVRWPGMVKPNSVNGNIVSLIDFAQTFLEAAGIEGSAEMQGRSLIPILRGTTPADWRKSLYYHYYEYPIPHRVRPHYGVITDRFKLVHYYKPDVDDWELLDRESDPLEVKSFYNDPAYAQVVKELHAELNRLRINVQDTVDPPRSAYGDRPFDQPAKAK
jgi:arylsulfatase A-like enzyme